MNKKKKEAIRLRFTEILHRITDYLLLGLISLVCSLPVVTTGAAAYAFYAVGLSLLKGDEKDLYRGYFHAFRSCFKKVTVCWLILLGGAILLTGNTVFYYFMAGNGAAWAQVGLGVCFVLGILVSLTGSFLFPLLSIKKSIRIFDAFKTAFYLSVKHVGWWAAKTAGQLVLAVFVWLVPFLVVFTPGILLYWNSFCADRIFRKYRFEDDGSPANE